MNTSNVRDTMQKLEPLDLSKCRTIGDIVQGMSRCSFGARMLGEVAIELCAWAQAERKPIILYDGRADSQVCRLLRSFCFTGWFKDVMTVAEYIRSPWFGGPRGGGGVLMVGAYAEKDADKLFAKAGPVIFINPFGMARPGQTRDGYFPNVVFSEPSVIIPILYCIFQERLEHRPIPLHYLLDMWHACGGVGREVTFGARTLLSQAQDTECTRFLTLSGAMTVAKMGLLICDLIDYGIVHHISSTGALMAHGLVEGIGCSHYKYDPKFDDQTLADQSLNRVTDTLEPEENFDSIEAVFSAVCDKIDGHRPMGSHELHSEIGKYLARHYPDARAILKSAHDHFVPIAVPAFIDSEIGNDLFVINKKREAHGRPKIVMDMERDTQVLFDMATSAKRMGIFSIGGGVPRNNTQNVAPLIEIANARLGLDLPPSQFFYGCRTDPTPLWFGNLSGCTYNEGGSWRKFNLKGMLAEVHADATITWPFMQAYVMSELGFIKIGR